MTDYIIISDDEDDDEVEIIDFFVNLDKDPTIVDLTNGDTPRSRKGESDNSTPPDESSRSSPPRAPQQEDQPDPTPTPAPQRPKPPSPPPQRFKPPSPIPRRFEPPPATPQWRKPPSQAPQYFKPPSQAPQYFKPPSQAPQCFKPPSPSPQRPKPSPLAPQHAKPPSPAPQEPKPPSQVSNPALKRPATDRELMLAKKEQGNKKFRCNALDEAIRNYKEAGDLAERLNDQEMSAILHFNLAMSYDKLGLYAQAADECAAAVKINDNYVKAHVKRAEIYMSQAKYDEAVICYEHISEIDNTKRDDAARRIVRARELAKTLRRRDQYEILGLRPNFSLEDLRTAYKKMARRHHPDKHSDADVVTRRIQERLFKEVSEAYTFFRKRFGA